MEDEPDYCIKRRDAMKTVNVIFVSDDLVGSPVVSKKEYERLLKQKVKPDIDKVNTPTKFEDSGNNVDNRTPKRKGPQTHDEVNNKRSKYIDDVELALAALENDDVEKLSVDKPSTLFGKGDVSAKMICDFENNVHTPKTPKSCNMNSSRNKITVGKSGKNLFPIQEDVSQSPYSLRKKFIKDIKEIQKILENSDDDFSASDSDGSYELSDDSVNDSSYKETSRHSNSNKSFFERYYDSKSNLKSINSTNSLKKLKNPKLTQEKLDELVKNFQITPMHKNCIKMLFSETLHLFNKWDFILSQNYNLLLYGAGSKREIISKYVERFLDFHPVIVVNGFFPNVAGKEIIDKICIILKIEIDSSDIIEKIQKRITNYNLKIYLAINNIDGMMLRNDKIQSLLSQLGRLDQIHIIASLDHINAPLIWNKSTSSEFNWVWYDTTTFLSYSEETVYEGNIMLQNSGKGTLSSLRNVFNSLTKNTRGIFMIILKKQIEAGSKKTGISFRELYQECRKELLISSDVGLRAQLKEFIDHLVLKQKRNADGEEYFMIMIENNILKQFLEEQEVF